MAKRDFSGWTADLTLGFPDIDRQHMEIVELIGKVWRSLASDGPTLAAERFLVDLDEFARNHFRDEEEVMARFACPDLEEHRQSHVRFEEKIRELDRRIAAREAVDPALLQSLMDWLAFHFRTIDRRYVDFITAHLEERDR